MLCTAWFKRPVVDRNKIFVGQRLIICLILCFSWILTIHADRTSNKIYIKLQDNIPCFRRLNATHQTGCASQRGGSVGVLQYIQTISELTDLLQNGQNYPYVIVTRPQLFSRQLLDELRNSGKINGVLLLYLRNETLEISHQFSPDQKCPNMNYGLYRGKWKNMACSVEWNRYGNSVLFEDWGFPIFLIRDDADAELLLNCYRDFNGLNSGKSDEWPYCAAELKSNMLAAKDTKTCMRRSRLVTNLNPTVICDPIGDRNIWLTIRPTNKSLPLAEKSLIVVAARLDAASEFDDFSPGAHTTVTGLVTLLAVAEALSKYKEHLASDFNVLFVLFNGEAFDYIGSSRMVYSMEKNVFPVNLVDDVANQPALINLTHIAHFIELSQLSQKGVKEAIFIHTDPISSMEMLINKQNAKIIEELKIQGRRLKLEVENPVANQPLPPASFQSFLAKANISGIVLTDHKNHYANNFYNSIFDVTSTLNQSSKETISLQNQIANIASAVAGTVYFLATNTSDENIPVNVSLINGLLDCYLNRTNCQLFNESVTSQEARVLPDQPLPLYVSVDTRPNVITKLTYQVLARLTGEMLNISKEDCHGNRDDQIFHYIWMQGENLTGVCAKTSANYSKAVSPAFDIDDYDFDSGLYSTWTESVWEQTSVRIFLKPSVKWESFVLSLGIVICLVSFIIVWFINRNADCLFVQDQVS